MVRILFVTSIYSCFIRGLLTITGVAIFSKVRMHQVGLRDFPSRMGRKALVATLLQKVTRSLLLLDVIIDANMLVIIGSTGWSSTNSGYFSL
jgi:hypothetical protein